MNQKRILAEFEITIEDQWKDKEDLIMKLFHDYLMINKFVDKVIHVTAYPMNYKLIVQHLEMPKEMIQ